MKTTVWSHDFDGRRDYKNLVWSDLHAMFKGTNVSVEKDDQLVIVQTWTTDDMDAETVRELIRQRVKFHPSDRDPAPA